MSIFKSHFYMTLLVSWHKMSFLFRPSLSLVILTCTFNNTLLFFLDVIEWNEYGGCYRRLPFSCRYYKTCCQIAHMCKSKLLCCKITVRKEWVSQKQIIVFTESVNRLQNKFWTSNWSIRVTKPLSVPPYVWVM